MRSRLISENHKDILGKRPLAHSNRLSGGSSQVRAPVFGVSLGPRSSKLFLLVRLFLVRFLWLDGNQFHLKN